MWYTTVITCLSLIPNLLNMTTFVTEVIYEETTYLYKPFKVSVVFLHAFIWKNKIDWLTYGIVRLHTIILTVLFLKLPIGKNQYGSNIYAGTTLASCKLDNRFCNELSSPPRTPWKACYQISNPISAFVKWSCTRIPCSVA